MYLTHRKELDPSHFCTSCTRTGDPLRAHKKCYFSMSPLTVWGVTWGPEKYLRGQIMKAPIICSLQAQKRRKTLNFFFHLHMIAQVPGLGSTFGKLSLRLHPEYTFKKPIPVFTARRSLTPLDLLSSVIRFLGYGLLFSAPVPLFCKSSIYASKYYPSRAAV